MSLRTDEGFVTDRGGLRMPWLSRILNPRTYLKPFKPARIRALWPRRFRVLVMVLLLQFRPQSLYRFSTQRLLPDKNRRLQKTSNPLDDFKIDRDRSSQVPPLGAVTVIQKGISFDASLVDQLPGPIYAVNWPEKLQRQDAVYVTADYSHLRRFVAEEMFPILFLEINRFDAQGNYHARDAGHEVESYLDDPRIDRISLYHHAGPQHVAGMPATSGLATVVALSFFAESIEVYGWDFYLTFAPAGTGYWKTFFRYFVNFRMEIQSQFVEMTIYNWHYAYRFSLLPNFKNYGYLSGLEKHQGINEKLDRVFYND